MNTIDRQQLSNMQIPQAITAIFTAIYIYLIKESPEYARAGLIILTILVTMDLLTGWLAAKAEGKLTSDASKRKGAIKYAIYLVIVGGGWLFARVTGGWYLMGPLLLWSNGTELLSIKENLTRSQKAGVKLGPLTGLDMALSGLERLITTTFPRVASVETKTVETEESRP
jgi:hypothetical protein